MKTRVWLGRNTDLLIALGLFVGYASWLLTTARSLGFVRDEGFYFVAARAYDQWLQLLVQNPTEALTPSVVDSYWAVNHEHPGLMKLLFALSSHLHGPVLDQASSGFRLPGMLMSSLAVAITFVWGRRVLGRPAGLVAALSLALMPRVFFHAHLACFDMPVCAMWLATSYAYSRSLASHKFGWALATGVMYGLLLDTKHNSWLFPFAIALHFTLTEAWPRLRDPRSRAVWWRRLPLSWASMLLLGPAVLYALWPWIWHDTWARLREYVLFHTRHEYYNMQFLGRTYWKPPMPLGYAWLMTLATVPLVTLVLAAIGGGVATRGGVRRASGRSLSRHHSDFVLWAVSILASYAPWLSANTPIFGGTKHWLTAYPFVCLFAGLGFKKVTDTLVGRLPQLGNVSLVGACVLVGPLVMTVHSHPFGLSAYTPLVGGAPGAASLGLNRTFWGYTTQQLTPYINQNAPKHAVVYVHDTALQSFAMFQEDGRLRRDLRGSLDIAASDVALYQYEPHMSRVEQQIWIAYGSVSPDAIAAYDGVPIAWAYVRRRH